MLLLWRCCIVNDNDFFGGVVVVGCDLKIFLALMLLILRKKSFPPALVQTCCALFTHGSHIIVPFLMTLLFFLLLSLFLEQWCLCFLCDGRLFFVVFLALGNVAIVLNSYATPS